MEVLDSILKDSEIEKVNNT